MQGIVTWWHPNWGNISRKKSCVHVGRLKKTDYDVSGGVKHKVNFIDF